ncbi:MAG TPA: LysR substrate-binding domain-containing protein [Mycobacteriales bacterium]|nr:LysR substrate-binding domain-containing protein [Mycobacteriales bacterium]
MLDVGRLRVLLAISEHGGLPAAARALAAPAPDVAAQLSGLERELGLTLVDGDRLTPAGRRLAAHGSRVLAELEAVESDAAAVANRASGVLRLGVGPAAGRALLPQALAALDAMAPELDLRVEQLTGERVAALGADRLDMAVVGEYAAAVPRRADPQLDRRELLTEQLLVAVPTRHRVTGSSVRLAELADERWVAGVAGSDVATALERAAAAAGFEPVVVARVGEDALALVLVAAGHGIGLVPASSVSGPVDGVRFLTALDAGLRRTVSAVVRRSAGSDPGVLRVLDALAQAARRVAAAVPGVTAAVAPVGAIAPETYRPLPPTADPGSRHGPAGLPPPLPGRRPDPLSDPLPGAADPLAAGLGRPGPADRQGERPYANGAGPADRRESPFPAAPVEGPYTNGAGPAGPPLPGGGPATLPGRRGPAGDPFANGTAAEYRREPAGDLWSTRPGPGGEHRGGPLPPPSPPADRPPRPRPAPGGGPDPGPAAPPPEVAVPYPTSADLGVRSLSSAELSGRLAEPGGRGNGVPHPDARSAGQRRPSRAESRADAPLGTLPPAPPGSAEEVRLSIFEDLQSEWFTRRGDALGPGSWESPADDGWRAAARLAEPPTAGTTTAGLPKRKPQAMYVPGAVSGGEGTNGTANGATTRSPQQVRGRLSSYRDGVRRGRHAEQPPPDA